jgi:hypothetical protein
MLEESEAPEEEEEEVVLSKEEDPSWFLVANEAGEKWWQFAPTSLCVLGHENGLRLFCIRIITHRWFENTILSLILANSLLLGIYDYLDPDN